MAADKSGGGGADARLSVQHIVQRPFALGSGGCRSVWRQIWPLQGCLAANLAAAGPLQGRYTRPPFVMVLLL